MELESSQSYANFRAWCPRKQVGIGVQHPITWRYYDWGPRTYLEPIICLHSLIGSAESFYQQLISLPPRGYRVISIQIPVYWTIAEFCDAFHAFLETIPHRRVHLYGAGLGGFLAMHYAVRKPENVASLILTHSFLATENLNLRVPYSTSVLRWLPDFLVRSTMRAILPKGRVSLQMANAAEFAIGHTMSSSRNVLASRLALSTTASTVVNRVHIPQTSITLIDALDRQQPALQLSQLTASQLPEARRAHLKFGGDFPYIAAPDDVNVHLIVHLRRNAASPALNIPVPVPARPRVISSVTRRRRVLEQERKRAEEMLKEESAAAKKKQKRARKSDEDLLKEAKALVAADETSRIERYAFEIGSLREMLPGKNDSFLAAVMEECEGVIDVAIENARAEMYDDRFYEDKLTCAIADKVKELQEAEKAAAAEQEEEGAARIANNEGGTEVTGDGSRSIEDDLASGIDIVAAYKRRGVLDEDPLRLKDASSEDTGANEMVDPGQNMSDDDTVPATSPPLRSSDPDTEYLDMNHDDPLVGLKPRNTSRSALSSVDLEVGEKYLSKDAGSGHRTDDDGEADGPSSTNLADKISGSRRQRRSRRRSYVEESDGVGAYVTSEKVGMRSRGPLVGRGPAPFSNAVVETGLSPGEAWKRAVRMREEEDVSMNDDKVTHISLSSGASLLEANENPLELPGHESQYISERIQHKADNHSGSGITNQGSGVRYTRDNGGQGPKIGNGIPPQPESYTVDVGMGSSQPEAVPATNVTDQVGGFEQQERDEWERFRERGRGLAGAIASPPRRGIERKVDRTMEKMDVTQEAEKEVTEVEGEETARLREWRMSAQAASKSVTR
eukprot:GFKZ01000864.1.p1 GENE.GFKZ01000864.1~~GFKZ01000864.1.p1  ORF type:complete len:846 (-),score=126.26 GFKZ01000864.1:970-3507(-)